MSKSFVAEFSASNKKRSILVLNLVCKSSQGAKNMNDVVDNLKTELANLKGTMTVDESDGQRDVFARLFNFLTVEHHDQLKTDCLKIMSRFDDKPELVVEQLAPIMAKMMEPKVKARKPQEAEFADAEDEPTPSRKGAAKEESDDAKEESEEEEKPEPKKKATPVWPKAKK
jgi:hypothetical protein